MPEWEKREVKVSPEDKQALIEHVDAINALLKKYPRFKDPTCSVVITMVFAKNAAQDLTKWIKLLIVEN